MYSKLLGLCLVISMTNAAHLVRRDTATEMCTQIFNGCTASVAAGTRFNTDCAQVQSDCLAKAVNHNFKSRPCRIPEGRLNAASVKAFLGCLDSQ